MQWLKNEQLGSGVDGVETISSPTTDSPTDAAALASITSTALTATNSSFAAGQIVKIHQTRGTGAGQWEYNVIKAYSTGAVTLKYPTTFAYVSGAQIVVMKQPTALVINSTLTVKPWNGTTGGILGRFVKGAVTGAGTINLGASGMAFDPGGATVNTGGFRAPGRNGGSGTIQGKQGEGTAGAGNSASNLANGNGGGGGVAGGSTAAGGSGGHATAGTDSGGTAGQAVGTANLVNQNLGGAGGCGAGQDTAYGGAGGNGGAIGDIVCDRWAFTGTINNDGSDGDPSSGTEHGAGAPGAGGSLLIKTRHGGALGSNSITAKGGSGKASNQGSSGVASDGRIAIYAPRASLITGTTNPTYTFVQDTQLASQIFGGII